MQNKHYHDVMEKRSMELGHTDEMNYLLINEMSNRIEAFLVVCIYEQNSKAEEIEKMIQTINQVKDNLISLPVFKERMNSKTYVIWDKAYKENEELFIKLRVASRNQVVLQIAYNVTEYLLIRYKSLSNSIISSEQAKDIIEHSIKNMEQVLKKDTFLAEDYIWDDFCCWFNKQLINWILEELSFTVDFKQLETLSTKELNALFHEYITKNFSENEIFLYKFLKIVNGYIGEWKKTIIKTLKLETVSLQEIERLLCLNTDSLQTKNSTSSPIKEITSTFGPKEHIFVMNNAPYQLVREAIYKRSFRSINQSPWPTAFIEKGNTKGIIQIIPTPSMPGKHQEPIIIQEARNQAHSLSDVDVDVFDSLCSIFIAKARHSDEFIEINVDDLLAIRGLKSKLGGEGRRGGFEAKQREQILKSLVNIQNIWIDLEKVIIYEKGKRIQTKLQGRTFIFKDDNGCECIIAEQTGLRKITFTIDKMFAKYLNGSGRQVALLAIQALQYNPYRQVWEKRISRYLSWRWRTQARKGSFLQANKVSTILEAIGEKINNRTPSRTRERLEKALDVLLEDGVIVAWHYDKWDEIIAEQKGWARIWLDSMIYIEPPDVIKEQYRLIEKSHKIGKEKTNKILSESKFEPIGEDIRKVRKKLGLSLFQLSEELEISPPYISSIERGMKVPSRKIRTKLMKWLERYSYLL